MNDRKWLQVLLGSVLTAGALAMAIATRAAEEGDRFFCDEDNGIPVTVVRNSDGREIPIMKWEDDSFLPNLSPQERCEMGSAQFQTTYKEKTLKYIRGDWMNGKPVICVVKSKDGNCLPSGLIITLKPTSDPNLTLLRLLSTNAFGIGKPIDLSGRDIEFIKEENDYHFFDLSAFLESRITDTTDELLQ